MCCSALLISSPVFAGDEKSPAVSVPTITASPAKPAPPEATVASAMTTSSQPFSVEMHMTMDGQETVMKRTVDGPKTRMDITSKDMNQTIIMMGDDKKTMYMIDPANKRAMKMSPTTAMERLNSRAPAPAPDAKPQGQVTLVGHETIDGRAADKYEVDYGDQGKGTMWIDSEKNLPLRMEAQGTKIDFENYQFGTQPADAFESPKGYEVTDMDEMMAKMPKNAMGGMAQAMAGGMMGSMGGSMGGGLGASLGGMLGGPIGSMVGQFVGQKIGQKLGSSVGQKAAGMVTH
jgi:outer membrane lipoprotein-sorting protein